MIHIQPVPTPIHTDRHMYTDRDTNTHKKSESDLFKLNWLMKNLGNQIQELKPHKINNSKLQVGYTQILNYLFYTI